MYYLYVFQGLEFNIMFLKNELFSRLSACGNYVVPNVDAHKEILELIQVIILLFLKTSYLL